MTSHVTEVVIPTTSVVDNHPAPKPKGPPLKRKRFNKISQSAQPSYLAAAIPVSLAVQPTKRYFEIYTGTKGLLDCASTVYSALITRDRHLREIIPKDVFLYVSTLAFYHRLYSVGYGANYWIPTFTITRLKQLCEPLLLPDILCQLLESIGLVVSPIGITYVPLIPSCVLLQDPEWYTHPSTIPINGVAGDYCPFDDQNGYREDVIKQYLTGIPRSFKSGLKFRRVNWTTIEGKLESTVSTLNVMTGTEAWTLFPMENDIAHLGACYRFRDLERRGDWPGGDNEALAYVFHSTSINVDLTYTAKVISSLNPLPGISRT